MSAAFALSPSGPPVRCDFPGCVGDSFHEGKHTFGPELVAVKPGGRHYRCTICKRGVVEYGEYISGGADLCDSQECLLAWSLITSRPVPLSCTCRQRPYAHDLSIHTQLRGESFNPKLRNRWPWALMLSPRVEPSTEGRRG
jgi:hypothetical protein